MVLLKTIRKIRECKVETILIKCYNYNAYWYDYLHKSRTTDNREFENNWSRMPKYLYLGIPILFIRHPPVYKCRVYREVSCL